MNACRLKSCHASSFEAVLESSDAFLLFGKMLPCRLSQSVSPMANSPPQPERSRIVTSQVSV